MSEVTSMVFLRVTPDGEKMLWSTPTQGPWWPIPRVGEQVCHRNVGWLDGLLWRVVDVQHVWGPAMGPLPGSRCYHVHIYVEPEPAKTRAEHDG